NQNELIFGTSSGLIHALRADGSELPGWPVHVSGMSPGPPEDTPATSTSVSNPANSDPQLSAVVSKSYTAVLASVAVGDLDRSGKLEVVAADMSGYIYVFEASATYCAGIGQTAPCVRQGSPVHQNYAFTRQGLPGFFNRHR